MKHNFTFQKLSNNLHKIIFTSCFLLIITNLYSQNKGTIYQYSLNSGDKSIINYIEDIEDVCIKDSSLIGIFNKNQTVSHFEISKNNYLNLGKLNPDSKLDVSQKKLMKIEFNPHVNVIGNLWQQGLILQYFYDKNKSLGFDLHIVISTGEYSDFVFNKEQENVFTASYVNISGIIHTEVIRERACGKDELKEWVNVINGKENKMKIKKEHYPRKIYRTYGYVNGMSLYKNHLGFIVDSSELQILMLKKNIGILDWQTKKYDIIYKEDTCKMLDFKLFTKTRFCILFQDRISFYELKDTIVEKKETIAFSINSNYVRVSIPSDNGTFLIYNENEVQVFKNNAFLGTLNYPNFKIVKAMLSSNNKDFFVVGNTVN